MSAVSVIAIANSNPIVLASLIGILVAGFGIFALVEAVRSLFRKLAHAKWQSEHRCVAITKKGEQCKNYDCGIH